MFQLVYARSFEGRTERFRAGKSKRDRSSSLYRQIAEAPDRSENENEKSWRCKMLSKKTLPDSFIHYERNVNVFQPAIDISEKSLTSEIRKVLAMEDPFDPGATHRLLTLLNLRITPLRRQLKRAGASIPRADASRATARQRLSAPKSSFTHTPLCQQGSFRSLESRR